MKNQPENYQASEEEEASMETRRYNLVSEIKNKSNAITKIDEDQCNLFLQAALAFFKRAFRFVKDIIEKNHLLEQQNQELKDVVVAKNLIIQNFLFTILQMKQQNGYECDQNLSLLIGQINIYNNEEACKASINEIRELLKI